MTTLHSPLPYVLTSVLIVHCALCAISRKPFRASLAARLAGQLDLSLSVYNLLDRRFGNPGTEEHRPGHQSSEWTESSIQTRVPLPPKK